MTSTGPIFRSMTTAAPRTIPHSRSPSRARVATRRSLAIEPQGPFSLAAAARFACGFTPASGRTSAARGSLRMAFALDNTFEPVGVTVRQRGNSIELDVAATVDAEIVVAQVARILSLDHDGRGYPEVGARDPVVGQLLRELDHLRPVCFGSPYEAAGWAIIAQRQPMQQAARVQAALATHLESHVEVDGERLLAFPQPERILEVQRFAGLPDEKLARLHGIARAALTGQLDAARLRALPTEVALAELRSLRGLGPWSAAHVLLRGAGVADEPAFGEPRVVRGFALANRLEQLPTREELERAAEAWRPYRSWISVLFAVFLARAGRWAEGAADGRG